MDRLLAGRIPVLETRREACHDSGFSFVLLRVACLPVLKSIDAEMKITSVLRVSCRYSSRERTPQKNSSPLVIPAEFLFLFLFSFFFFSFLLSSSITRRKSIDSLMTSGGMIQDGWPKCCNPFRDKVACLIGQLNLTRKWRELKTFVLRKLTRYYRLFRANRCDFRVKRSRVKLSFRSRSNFSINLEISYYLI